MNGSLLGVIAVVVILGSLALFGRWFNGQIERWGNDMDGFTWLLVVIGTFVTLIGMGLLDLVLDWNAGLLGLVAFTASGLHMAYGAIRRYILLRRRLKDMT